MIQQGLGSTKNYMLFNGIPTFWGTLDGQHLCEYLHCSAEFLCFGKSARNYRGDEINYIIIISIIFKYMTFTLGFHRIVRECK